MTLLERIAAMEKGEQNKGTYTARLYRSLTRHLADMLNTRRGNVPIDPNYGMADVTDLGSSFTEESVTDIKEELERVVMQYEPRLSAVHVEYTPRPDAPLAAVFSLEASIRTESGSIMPLRFETILDADGTIRLQGEDEFQGIA
jgi:type VI secretion system protein